MSLLYHECLTELAAQAYQLSDQLCGSCRDLHALWPYIRLSRSSTGVEERGSPLTDVLQGLIAGARRDVLIAGAADTGLLALVARAAARAGHRVNIVVLDICETPLELCRRFAQQWSIPIETVRQDLRELNVRHRFDLVLVHGTLHFIEKSGRAAAAMRIRDSLRPDGRMVLLFNTSKALAPQLHDELHAEYAIAVLSELRRQQITLPDAEAVIHGRLAAHSRRRQMREGAFAKAADAKQLLETAGFKIISCELIDVRFSSKAADYVSRMAKQRFMLVAAPSL
jgi:SAM-dependent methyltransferase